MNILAADQIELSNRFATRRDDKFDNVEFTQEEGGAPLLGGCAAHLICRQEFRHYGGDHIIFIGRVIKFDRSEREPLIYCAGEYVTARAIRPRKPESGAK